MLDPLLLWLLSLLGALVTDEATGPDPEPGPDLRQAVQAGRAAGATDQHVRRLWTLLYPAMGDRWLFQWYDQAPLPPAGLQTRFDGIATWLLGRLVAGDAVPRAVPVGFDMEMPLGEIADWANATDIDPVGLTWAEAHEAAWRWWSSEVRHIRPRTPVPEATVLIRWPDGARVDRIQTPHEIDSEGLSMDHCLRRHLHYRDDSDRGDIVLLSYRDPTGIPQATVEVDVTGRDDGGHPEPRIVQLQGPCNGPISDPEARARLAWLLFRRLGFDEQATEVQWRARVDLAEARAAWWSAEYDDPLEVVSRLETWNIDYADNVTGSLHQASHAKQPQLAREDLTDLVDVMYGMGFELVSPSDERLLQAIPGQLAWQYDDWPGQVLRLDLASPDGPRWWLEGTGRSVHVDRHLVGVVAATGAYDEAPVTALMGLLTDQDLAQAGETVVEMDELDGALVPVWREVLPPRRFYRGTKTGRSWTDEWERSHGQIGGAVPVTEHLHVARIYAGTDGVVIELEPAKHTYWLAREAPWPAAWPDSQLAMQGLVDEARRRGLAGVWVPDEVQGTWGHHLLRPDAAVVVGVRALDP